jgi:hypothetical protein
MHLNLLAAIDLEIPILLLPLASNLHIELSWVNSVIRGTLNG